jgi:RAB protein geranylgeranyltransferase component A
VCTYWQAFARLSAVYGGTYMLNKPECKVKLSKYESPFTGVIVSCENLSRLTP